MSQVFGLLTLHPPQLAPAVNGACSAAQSLTFSGGAATASGDTYGVADEFPTLKCGLASALDGPQAYYRTNLVAKQAYKITLSSTFTAYLVIFAGTSVSAGSEISSEYAKPVRSPAMARTPTPCSML